MQQQLVLHNDEGRKYLNRTEVAGTLGIGKSTISYWIKRNNLSVKGMKWARLYLMMS